MMLKKAVKSKRGIQDRILASQTRNLYARHMYDEENKVNRRQKRMKDIQADVINSVGVVRMNREFRKNLLTPNFIRQIARGVETMSMDHSVEVIYLAPAEGKTFSNGTDFRTIMHYKAEKETEKLAKYLGDVFKLQVQFAKTNKVIMSVAPGQSFNSGAGLVAASGLPAITGNTLLAFNECTFGFVPHAGSTYYTSRLPGDFGTFLALTGMPLTGNEAIELKLADSLVQVPKTLEHEVADIISSIDPTWLPSALSAREGSHTGVGEHDQVNQNQYQRLEALKQRRDKERNEMMSRKGIYNYMEPFVDPLKRKPDLTAETDLLYERMLEDKSEALVGRGGKGFFEIEGTTFNFFEYMHSYLKLYTNAYCEKYDQLEAILKHRELIDRCFWPNSVEEIMDNLRRDTDPYAKVILERMQNNSMLSMKIALKMLRKAKNMAYGEVLKMELNVALNKVADSDFETGVREVLMKPPNSQVKTNPGFKKEVTHLEVESYFSENKLASQIDLDIVENSLLPTRAFFEKFEDSVRLWVNETSTHQHDVREAVPMEIEDALRIRGIDLRDKTITIPRARELIQKQLRSEAKQEEFLQRSLHLSSDPKLRAWYRSQVDQEFKKLESSNTQLYELVNKQIQEIFEQSYLQRLGTIIHKSKEAHSLEKRRLFIQLKKFLLKKRLLTSVEEEAERLAAQVENLPFKQMHMEEKWDQNFRELEHPDIQQSVMWHLSKVVGKTNLAPPEMIKTFVTDPEAAKGMTSFVFDKDDLMKLRQDLIENPEKYEEILLHEREQSQHIYGTDHGEYFRHLKLREENRKYFHRVYNDGRCDVPEQKHMRIQYYNYKHWAEDIKNKSLDTLRLCVNRLLLDFENDKQLGNRVEQFVQDKNETKRSALKRLYTMLNEEDSSKAKGNKPESATAKGGSKLKNSFADLIDEDPMLSQVFGSKAESHDNSMIKRFRQDMLNELYQLVEVVLIKNQIRDIGNKKDGSAILSQLMNAANKNDRVAKLEMLDQLLNDQLMKRTLKEAIMFVKPFFFEVFQEKLEQEAKTVLEGFKKDQTQYQALQHFWLNDQYPKFKDNKVLSKIQQYHDIQDRISLVEKQLPEKRALQGYKDLMSMVKVGNSWEQGKTLEEKEKLMAQQAKEALLAVRSYQELVQEQQNLINDDVQRKEREKLKQPLDDEYRRKMKEENTLGKALAPGDILEFEQMHKRVAQFEDLVKKHEHEIDTLIGPEQWLDVYCSSVQDHALDVDNLIWASSSEESYMQQLYKDESSLDQARRALNVPKSFTWNDLADYGQFLRGLFKEKRMLEKEIDYQENLETMIEFMSVHEAPERNSSSLKGESLFSRIVAKRYAPQSQTKTRTMQAEIQDFQGASMEMQQQARLKQECLEMVATMDSRTKQQVLDAIGSSSKYINFQALANNLRGGATELKIETMIDSTKLMKDVAEGKALNSFVSDFKDVAVDVISLTELAKMLEDKADGESVSQMKTVLNHLNENLNQVSHERRQQLTLGEFMSQHNGFNPSTLSEYSRSIHEAQKNAATEAIITAHPGGMDGGSDIDQSLAEAAFGHVSKPQNPYYLSSDGTLTNDASEANKLQEIVYAEAMKAAEFSPELAQVRNQYENDLLKEYTRSSLIPTNIDGLIKEYMNIRLKECMVRPAFARGLKSAHANVYMRILRENIIDELKLTDSAKKDDFVYEKSLYSIMQENMNYNLESQYNLDDLNNEQAIGYQNLEARAADTANNQSLAHESTFDKMMAEYFLDKRGEYKKGNKLLQDLEKVFQVQYPDPEMRQNQTLGEQYKRQTQGKSNQLQLEPHNFPALMELDAAVNRQLHNNTSGLSPQMRVISEEDVDIPEYFEIGDVRKPADLFVKDVVRSVLDDLFTARRGVEKYMSRRELLAYDKVLSKCLERDVLIEKLRREIDKTFNMMDQVNQLADQVKDNQLNREKQALKERNTQPEFNRKIVNEDAFYKFLAYTGMLEKQRSADTDKLASDPQIYAGIESFENVYQDELWDSIHTPPRPINEADYRPKRLTVAQQHQEKEYQGMRAERDAFLEDHKLYKENKLEMHERSELLTVLEKLRTESQKELEQGNKMKEASMHIHEYFKDPANVNLSQFK